jgi:hypothetical protein
MPLLGLALALSWEQRAAQGAQMEAQLEAQQPLQPPSPQSCLQQLLQLPPPLLQALGARQQQGRPLLAVPLPLLQEVEVAAEVAAAAGQHRPALAALL